MRITGIGQFKSTDGGGVEVVALVLADDGASALIPLTPRAYEILSMMMGPGEGSEATTEYVERPPIPGPTEPGVQYLDSEEDRTSEPDPDSLEDDGVPSL